MLKKEWLPLPLLPVGEVDCVKSIPKFAVAANAARRYLPWWGLADGGEGEEGLSDGLSDGLSAALL